MAAGRAGLEHSQKQDAADQQEDCKRKRQHTDPGGWNAYVALGPDDRHGGRKLPARRRAGNRRSLETAAAMGDIMHVVIELSSSLALPRTLALVGLMGAGKTAIGKRLALRLGLPFVDADDEIERAAGCTVSEFFERYGETEFRNGERRVIARLLEGPQLVLSTGGGAYMDAATRALLHERALTVWLRADLDVLFDRVKRRGNRPLLKLGNPRDVLARLMNDRYPVYAEADLTVESSAQPADVTTEHVLEALRAHLAAQPAGVTA
jgi:shikimate kinase